MKHILLLIAAGASCSAFAWNPFASRFALAEKGRPCAEIVIAPQATRAAQFGALELRLHLKAITGADFAIVTPTNRTASLKPIYVGRSEPVAALGCLPAAFGRQEHLVRITKDEIVLVGEDKEESGAKPAPVVFKPKTVSTFETAYGLPSEWDERGSLNAVYDFLENECRVEWFDPSDDGTRIVPDPSLAVATGERKVQPFVFCRDMHSEVEHWRTETDGYARERRVAYADAHIPDRWTAAAINVQNGIWYLRRRLGGERMAANHSFMGWYDRFLNKDSPLFEGFHPEYFAQRVKDQDRSKILIESTYNPRKRPPQLCYSSDAVVSQAVADVREYFDKGGVKTWDKAKKCVVYKPTWGVDACCLEPMDNDGFCQCAKCRAEYPKNVDSIGPWDGTSRNDHWFNFVNKVAREIRKSHPAKRVSTLAYMSHTAAPSFKMEDNVVVHFCHHANRYPNSAPLDKYLDGLMKDWAKVLKPGNLGLWFYSGFPRGGVPGMGCYSRCFPGNYVDMHGAQFRDLVKACNARECIYYCGCTGDIEQYASSRWMWNPDEPSADIKARWFAAYGAAGPAVREFYEIIERRFADVSLYEGYKGHQNERIAWEKLCTPEVDRQLAACAARAFAAKGLSAQERARLERWRVGTWEYMRESPRQVYELESGRSGVVATRTVYKNRLPELYPHDVLKGETVYQYVVDAEGVPGKKGGQTDKLTNGCFTNNVCAYVSTVSNIVWGIEKPVDKLRRFRISLYRGDYMRGKYSLAPVGLVNGRWIELAGVQESELVDMSGSYTWNIFDYTFAEGSVPEHLDGIGVREQAYTRGMRASRYALLEAETAKRDATPFNDGWERKWDDAAAYKAVTLPEDAMLDRPYVHDKDLNEQGYKRGGILRYRKTFAKPAGAAEGFRYALRFDGVYMDSKVYLNGKLVAARPNGYIGFEAPLDELRDSNLVEVVCDVRTPCSRWYSGAGIQRDVWLVARRGWTLEPEQVFVHYETTDYKTALVRVEVEGAEVIEPAGGVAVVRNPVYWSPENPKLYEVRVRARNAAGEEDERIVTYGMRRFLFRKDHGLSLNNRGCPIRGVCLHEGQPCLGAQLSKPILEYQLAELKKIGVNAIRTAHNPQPPYFYDLCDRMGFLVMDEIFDEWMNTNLKTKNGYNRFFREWWKTDLEAQVRRDRNHPCVLLWSVGNEIPEMRNQPGAEPGGLWTKRLADAVRALDPTRPVTAGCNAPLVSATNGVFDALDVVGFNYGKDAYRELRAKWKTVASETAATHSLRGVYNFSPDEKDPSVLKIEPFVGKLADARGGCCFWGDLSEKALQIQGQNGWCAGEFVWSGFDYLGEGNLPETPELDYWPSRSAYWGLFDRAGLPKDVAWLYRSQWTTNATVHLATDWTFPQAVGKKLPVWCYSNAKETELFLNGRSLGKGRRKDLHFEWLVAYEPGVLEVKATFKDGTVGTDRRETAGPFARLRVTKLFEKDGVRLIRVDAVDAKGNLILACEDEIEIPLDGGTLLGSDNGNPLGHTPFLSPRRKLFRGSLGAVIKQSRR